MAIQASVKGFLMMFGWSALTCHAKAKGYKQLVEACGNDAKSSSTMLLIEKLEEIVRLQTEAIKNIKIDKITVWASGNNEKGSSTSHFISL